MHHLLWCLVHSRGAFFFVGLLYFYTGGFDSTWNCYFHLFYCSACRIVTKRVRLNNPNKYLPNDSENGSIMEMYYQVLEIGTLLLFEKRVIQRTWHVQKRTNEHTRMNAILFSSLTRNYIYIVVIIIRLIAHIITSNISSPCKDRFFMKRAQSERPCLFIVLN